MSEPGHEPGFQSSTQFGAALLKRCPFTPSAFACLDRAEETAIFHKLVVGMRHRVFDVFCQHNALCVGKVQTFIAKIQRALRSHEITGWPRLLDSRPGVWRGAVAPAS